MSKKKISILRPKKSPKKDFSGPLDLVWSTSLLNFSRDSQNSILPVVVIKVSLPCRPSYRVIKANCPSKLATFLHPYEIFFPVLTHKLLSTILRFVLYCMQGWLLKSPSFLIIWNLLILQILYPFTVTLPIHQFYAKKVNLKLKMGSHCQIQSTKFVFYMCSKWCNQLSYFLPRSTGFAGKGHCTMVAFQPHLAFLTMDCSKEFSYIWKF